MNIKKKKSVFLLFFINQILHFSGTLLLYKSLSLFVFPMLNQAHLLQKYGDIIKEEVNVKEIWPFLSDSPIKKIFKPIGSQLSAKFGKDTGQIISNGKQWNIKELEDWKILVFSPAGGEWILDSDSYEVSYEWLDSNDIAIDGNMIAKLELEITPELEREGVARELSRFLNQMRKDADFSVEEKVRLTYTTESQSLSAIISEFSDFLQGEALLASISQKEETWNITAVFSNNQEAITLTLSR